MNKVENKENRVKEDTELIKELVFNTNTSLNKLNVLSEYLLDLQVNNNDTKYGDTTFYIITMIIDYVKQGQSSFEDLSMIIESKKLI